MLLLFSLHSLLRHLKLATYPIIPLFLSSNLFSYSSTGVQSLKLTNRVSTIEPKQHQNHANLVSKMDHSTTQGSASNTSVTSIHICNSENGPPGRYTCYDIGTFLALYIVLGTTCTVDVAGEAYEQSEKASKAHQNVEITDAHVKMARRPGRKVRRDTGENQAGEKGADEISRIGKWLEKVVRNLKAE